ncbi:hypothetical protein [Duganella phyllosphaerae]|uniref:Glycosyltransferase RgtA/B/C/D-like domain-containing protein n=1 Tax=Duganella phyllosphaerae TaxID=762836 RepID=A0A1E7WLX5_9BURK|nr:hypothetical protein [Duganella phyllosphaerae]OFA00013.1 hypothetical protein DUPY_24780 [Duganella phyllosphaerae]
MTFFSSLAALKSWCLRHSDVLRHRHAGLFLALVVPLLCGLVSLFKGQDDGWDMRNYHLYNVHALLNDRVGFDIAAAGFQTYFNPTIELSHYLLGRWLSPPLAGMLMGVLHGLNFVLVMGITRQLIGPRHRLVILLAIACLFVPGFQSELGNSMGDNLTALLVLLSLYLVLRNWRVLPQWRGAAALAMAGSGLAMGCATGLKLTNGTFALALGLSLLAIPLPWWQRLRLLLVWGMAALAGVAATAGWWFLKMWQLFGNPVFPQFNDIFRSPLGVDLGVFDVAFRPVGGLENLLWPFIFTLNPRRVSELQMQLFVWPVLYCLLAVMALLWIVRRSRRPNRPEVPQPGRAELAPPAAFVLLFFALSYLVWMRMFSIYRYLVPIELLAPLMIWIVWSYIAPRREWAAAVLLAVLAVCVFPIANWGHQPWSASAIRAELPAIAAPQRTTVFLLSSDSPMTWATTLFPQPLRFVSIGPGFAQSPAWLQRRDAAIAERDGQQYMLYPAPKNDEDGWRQRKLELARSLRLTEDAAGCRKLTWLLGRARHNVVLRDLPSGGCTLELTEQERLQQAALERARLAELVPHWQQFGLRTDVGSCTVYRAYVGTEPYRYYWCKVTYVPPAT